VKGSTMLQLDFNWRKAQVFCN